MAPAIQRLSLRAALALVANPVTLPSQRATPRAEEMKKGRAPIPTRAVAVHAHVYSDGKHIQRVVCINIPAVPMHDFAVMLAQINMLDNQIHKYGARL